MPLIVFILGIFLVCAYYLSGKDFLSPAVLFTAGFFCCAFVAMLASDIWNYEPSELLFYTLLGGVFTFIAASVLFQTLFPIRKNASHILSRNLLERPLPLSNASLMIFLVILVVTFILTLREISSFYPATSIPESIRLYNDASKFSEEGAESFSIAVKVLWNLSLAIGYILAYYLACSLVSKNHKHIAFAAVCFTGSLLVSLETGGRAPAVKIITTFLICYLMLKRTTLRKGSISLKPLFLSIVVIVLVLVSFQSIAYLLGRESARDPLEYLSIYVGAQIPNLDYFLNNVGQQEEDIWGKMTFAMIIRTIGTRLGLVDFYQIDQPFIAIDGQDMGNVYTTFYSFIYDFGYVGMVFLVILMAFISWLVYRKACEADGRGLSSFWVILYGIVGLTLFMAFFSNWFFESVAAIGFLVIIMGLLVCYAIIFVFRETPQGVPGYRKKNSRQHLASADHVPSAICYPNRRAETPSAVKIFYDINRSPTHKKAIRKVRRLP